MEVGHGLCLLDIPGVITIIGLGNEDNLFFSPFFYWTKPWNFISKVGTTLSKVYLLRYKSRSVMNVCMYGLLLNYTIKFYISLRTALPCARSLL